MKNSNYQNGKWAENLVGEKLSWEIGRKVIRHVNYDESGNEIWQNVVVNGRRFICPDLEVYDNDFLTIRIEVKSFSGFPNNDIPFRAKSDLLIVSKRQLLEYAELQKEEEVPIFIVFTVDIEFKDPVFYWASINDILFTLEKREGLYTWRATGKTEPCYFFRAKDFYQDLSKL